MVPLANDEKGGMVMQFKQVVTSTVLALVAIMAVGAGSARADDFFAACSKDATGKLKGKPLVNAVPTCKAGETLRVWSQSGPPGEQGDPGIPTSCHVETFPG